MSKVLNDISSIRQRARIDIESGAVTSSYPLDVKDVIKRLNEALATELVCVLRYRRHYFMAMGIESEPIAQEFLQHSNEELAHADKLAKRIRQLGGEPNFNPDTMSCRSHSEYVEGLDLTEMIRENIVAERIAIESYRDLIEFVGLGDPTTRRMLEEILAVEEEHADELSDLLKT
jgi:bacterioferritin